MLPSNPKFIPSTPGLAFKYFCQKVLPAVYDESLSYYEMLCKLTAKINEVINTQSTQVDAIKELQDLYVELKNYVNNYFTSLDVQDEINNKLDSMVQAGTMSEIINEEIFNSLNDRLSTAEDNINTNTNDISSLSDSLDTTNNNVSTNHDRIEEVNTTLIEKIEDDDDTLDQKITALANKIYPVGSIYISASSIDPSTIFGGTWQQILNRFLVAAGDNYEVDSTGGEAEVTLTVEQLPSHNHLSAIRTNDGQRNSDTGDNWHNQGVSDTTTTPSTPTTFTGNNEPHNNIPPYYAVYMWKRLS